VAARLTGWERGAGPGVVVGGLDVGCRVLGPFEFEVTGRVVEVGGLRLRALLALLVANAGRVVSVAALVDGLWGSDPPADADRTVRTYVSLLRKALLPAPAAALIVTRRPGYVLRLEPDAVDASRFERLAAAGRGALAAGQPAVAADRLAAGLGLWRGEAYDEFAGYAALRAEAARLEQLRLAALVDRIEADLAVGVGGRLVAELEMLTARHPGHERLWGQLMTALYRAGRQTDALAAYRRAREAIIAESGVEPTPALTGIHRQVLAQDPRLLAPRPAGPAGDRRAIPPAQLPAAVAAFAGRDSELARLDAVLAAAGGQPTAVVISAVSGTAGVGKTALAVQWAHRVRERFPDGQLYVNLRGFDPGGRVMDPAAAVRGFLDALGVPSERVPAGLAAQVGLYRSLLAGKRVLVVIDNARDGEHARALLPGTGTAVAVVTSRSLLSDLVAVEGAHPLVLDLLTGAEGRQLLERRLGAGRVAAEPDAVDRIVGVCAGLPLALALVAARAATHPGFRLAALAAELADAASQPAGAADADDVIGRVRGVFSWSYATLTPAAARLFRLLGLHPGPDLTAPAAASLTGQPPARVPGLLAELARTGLIGEPVPGRYGFHDLLRAYATHLTHTVDTSQEREAATLRLLDHYTHTAHTAARQLRPARDPIPVPLTPPSPGTTPEPLPDQQTALAWLTAERPVLLATQQLATGGGWDTHTWQLAWTLDTLLYRLGRWQEWADAWRVALPAAGRLPHPATAAAYLSLGAAAAMQGDAEQAHSLQDALRLYAQAADPAGQAHTLHALSVLWHRRGRPEQALAHAQQALIHYQTAGHRRGEADALNAIGWYHAQLGDHTASLSYCQQSLTLHQQAGDRDGQADAWDSLGYAHHRLGHHTQAADCYQHALTFYRDLGDRYHEATTLTNLADTHHAAGHPDAARTAWTAALDILTDLNRPDADAVQAKLAAPDHTPPTQPGTNPPPG
jgi:DNA-binding SARP family transcriptional activator